jgi:hypothetical protein
MGTKDALRASVAADIANGVFGDLVSAVAAILLNKAEDAFDELFKQDE